AALEGDPGDADVRSAADGQTVGQLVADGGVDGEVLQLRPLREEAAAEGVRARPIAGETERRVDADAQHHALAELVRVVRGGWKEQPHVPLLRHRRSREGVGARERGRGMDERAAEIELVALEIGRASWRGRGG